MMFFTVIGESIIVARCFASSYVKDSIVFTIGLVTTHINFILDNMINGEPPR